MKYKKERANYTSKENIQMNEKNHLEVSGIDTIELTEKYGTPLMVYDIGTVRKNIDGFRQGLKAYKGQAEISYASKAFSSVALYQIIHQEDISIDVVSGGELYLAIQAGFPAEKINFHGNNKSIEELTAALDYQIGHIIVDNFHELELLMELSETRKQTVDIMIRITPGVSADTHRHIITGQSDSKFGFDLPSGQAEESVVQAMDAKYLNLVGIHMHIGSQLFDTESYRISIEEILKYIQVWQYKYDFKLEVFNIGGGFGVSHTLDENDANTSNQLKIISSDLMVALDKYDIPYPTLWIEPGRSIVGPAGLTLYEVGSQKNVPDVKHYVAINGGMTDNIRPSLYDAKYTALLANRLKDEADTVVSIAGKACESGDMLISDIQLPTVQAGDILAVLNTGDYSFAMASNYNRITRPAVVFVEDNKEFLAIRRETPEDFMRFEQFLPEQDIL